MTDTIYLPATDTRPAEPAPYLLTEQEVGRMLRLECEDISQAIARYRRKGLVPTQVGLHLRYCLPDVIQFLREIRGGNPR